MIWDFFLKIGSEDFRKMKSATGRKQVLVTITPYNEQEKRMNGSASGGGPPPPPFPLPTSPAKTKEDAVEMQSIESFKLKDSPSPIIPKPPPTYFSASSNSSPVTTPTNGSPRHSGPPENSQIDDSSKESINNQVPMEKKSITKIQNSNGSVTTTQSGKVAVRIGTYEGETKQPSRLDFLSQQGRTTTDAPKPVATEEVSSGPVVSRLQNELAATLQRSNLRKKTEEEKASDPQTPAKIVSSQDRERPVSLLQSNVEKLAAALSNRVTIKVNPENDSR